MISAREFVCRVRFRDPVTEFEDRFISYLHQSVHVPRNTPNAVGGSVHFQPTSERSLFPVIPPTQLGDRFISNLQRSVHVLPRNTPNGVGGSVHFQPTSDELRWSQTGDRQRLCCDQSRCIVGAVYLEPLSQVAWAYQLHYYLCFRTRSRRSLFSSPDRIEMLKRALQAACEEHNYHLLESSLEPDNLRCILSLRPQHSLSTVIQKIKRYLSHDLREQVAREPPLFERGYLARSVGRVRIAAVKQYLDNQSAHHGYSKLVHPPVTNYRAATQIELNAEHGWFDLSHHFVFATRWRRSIFGSRLGRDLSSYWLRVAAKRGFAIDRISVLPDHTHLLVRIPPKLSAEGCALSLMNNAQHWIAQNGGAEWIAAGLDQLWQPSAYAGTCGSVSTALMKRFLSRDAVGWK